MKPAFMETQRLQFCRWEESDLPEATLLWGDPLVTRWITATGRMTGKEIAARLAQEVERDRQYKLQYWPLRDKASGTLAGCCGLRPHGEGELELGVHLRPDFWGKGLGQEACRAALWYAFERVGTSSVFAGHNPGNTASPKLLGRLGFHPAGEEFYPPTGLYHPSYRMERGEFHPLESPAWIGD